jgi:hypothetical protein
MIELKISPLEKKMGITWEKLSGHLCCEPCYKHFVMALARIKDPLEVKTIQKTLLFKSNKKKLPMLVDQIFDRKFKMLLMEKTDDEKETS